MTGRESERLTGPDGRSRWMRRARGKTLRLCVDEAGDVQPKGLGHTGAVSRVSTEEMTDLAKLDFLRNACHVPGDVADQAKLLVSGHEAEQVSSLGEIIVSITMVVASGVSMD